MLFTQSTVDRETISRRWIICSTFVYYGAHALNVFTFGEVTFNVLVTLSILTFLPDCFTKIKERTAEKHKVMWFLSKMITSVHINLFLYLPECFSSLSWEKVDCASVCRVMWSRRVMQFHFRLMLSLNSSLFCTQLTVNNGLQNKNQPSHGHQCLAPRQTKQLLCSLWGQYSATDTARYKNLRALLHRNQRE
jgi:hypothetical protein